MRAKCISFTHSNSAGGRGSPLRSLGNYMVAGYELLLVLLLLLILIIYVIEVNYTRPGDIINERLNLLVFKSSLAF